MRDTARMHSDVKLKRQLDRMFQPGWLQMSQKLETGMFRAKLLEEGC